MNWYYIVGSFYVAIAVVSTAAGAVVNWSNIWHEARGRRSRAGLMVLALFSFMLVAWYVPMFWAAQRKWRHVRR